MKSALIIGTGKGQGISSSFARALHSTGTKLVLSARDTDKLSDLSDELEAHTVACDVSNAPEIISLFEKTDELIGTPDVVLYNPSMRERGPIAELDAERVRKALMVTAYGAFVAGQEAARRMIPRGSGAIFFTGASAGLKGFPQSAPFAMGKFALRGLAQSMARELHPKGIHVAHFNIDGGVRNSERPGRSDADGPEPDSFLDPDAIAQTYMHTLGQHRSAWSHEVELRPWVEKF